MPRSAESMRRTAQRGKEKLAGYDAVREIACDAVGLTYARRRVSDAKTPVAAMNCHNLPSEWTIEVSNALGKQIVENGRYAYPGQTRANGRELAPLRP